MQLPSRGDLEGETQRDTITQSSKTGMSLYFVFVLLAFSSSSLASVIIENGDDRAESSRVVGNGPNGHNNKWQQNSRRTVCFVLSIPFH
jgi:hypothetical protein